MLTNDSPPEMEGQQLMDSGTRLSSLVCAAHKQAVTQTHRISDCPRCSLMHCTLMPGNCVFSGQHINRQ